MYLSCARHLSGNVERHVKNRNAGKDLTDEIMGKIFNKRTGLYSATSKGQFDEMFSAFESRYGKCFKESWLKKLKETLWFESIKPSIVFKSINKKWNNNRVRIHYTV